MFEVELDRLGEAGEVVDDQDDPVPVTAGVGEGLRVPGGDEVQVAELNNLMRNAAGIGLLAAVGVFSVVWFLTRGRITKLARGFEGLDAAARRMAGGDLEVELPASDTEELRKIGGALDVMRRDLKRRMEELIRAAERERRKSEILSRLTRGEKLQEVLNAVARFTEREDPTIRASVLLLDPERQSRIPGQKNP